jgi:hypothetical protein
MADETAQQKLARYEYVLGAQMAKITKLREENERLTSALGAHGTLKAIYSDGNQPAGLRVKAAQAALPHETPKLMSVPPPLELAAEPVVPLAELVEARRARQDQLCPESAETSKRSDGHFNKVLDLMPVAPRLATTGNGNGDGSTDD